MNKVILIGNIVKDIEMKQTNSGLNVVANTIAVKRNYKNANDEYESDFINFVAFKNNAELISQYFTKGNRIGLTGSWQTRNYENNQGQKVYVNELIVDGIEFLQTNKKTTKIEDPFEIEDDLPF